MNASASGKEKKDAWDKLEVLGSPLIALVGLLFTYTYNQRQEEQQKQRELTEAHARQVETARLADSERDRMFLQRLETISKFFPALAGPNERERRAAILLVSNLGGQELAGAVATLDSRPGSQDALDAMFASDLLPDSSQRAAAAPASISVPSAKGQGWIYLGDYESGSQTWRTKYFEATETNPLRLTGAIVRVREEGPLNVRAGMPSTFGKLANITNGLKPGTEMTVREVRPWQNSGFFWARVEYK